MRSHKPVSEQYRPEITSLPALTPWRRLARRFLCAVARLLVWLLTRPEIKGLENVPLTGAVLVVSNHLGDADLVLGLSLAPRPVDILGKAELRAFPLVGWLMRTYGVIWVHRGRPDRRALRAVLQGLEAGRMICLSPEGRESVTGALEEGTLGAAYLAYKSGAPLLPVTVTGTENARVYGNLRRFRRTQMSITIGPLFYLEPAAPGESVAQDWRVAVERGTRQIMHTLAAQLPPEYQGIYARDELPARHAGNSSPR